MNTANLFTRVRITLTISETIDAQTYQDTELLEAWIYDQVMLGNSEWLDVDIREEIIDLED